MVESAFSIPAKRLTPFFSLQSPSPARWRQTRSEKIHHLTVSFLYRYGDAPVDCRAVVLTHVAFLSHYVWLLVCILFACWFIFSTLTRVSGNLHRNATIILMVTSAVYAHWRLRWNGLSAAPAGCCWVKAGGTTRKYDSLKNWSLNRGCSGRYRRTASCYGNRQTQIFDIHTTLHAHISLTGSQVIAHMTLFNIIQGSHNVMSCKTEHVTNGSVCWGNGWGDKHRLPYVWSSDRAHSNKPSGLRRHRGGDKLAWGVTDDPREPATRGSDL